VLVAFNLGEDEATIDVTLDGHWQPVEGHGLAQGRFADGRLRLPGHGVLFASHALVTA
jgi:alpha-glucosidase